MISCVRAILESSGRLATLCAELGQYATQLRSMNQLQAQALLTGNALRKYALVQAGLGHEALLVQSTMTLNVCPAIADTSCPVVCAERGQYATQLRSMNQL